jgi:hypothetical protein
MINTIAATCGTASNSIFMVVGTPNSQFQIPRKCARSGPIEWKKAGKRRGGPCAER